MAIAYESDGGTVWCNANNNNAITVPLPGTMPTDSVLLLVATNRLITATVTTAPDGYTLMSGFPKTSGTASGGRIWVYYRIVDGTEVAPSIALSGTTGTSGDLWGAYIICYSGVSVTGGVPDLDGTTTVQDAAGTTTCTYPAITTATVGSMIVRLLRRIRDAADTFTPTANPAHDEREDIGSTTRTGGQHHLQDRITTATGNQAAVTVAPSNTTSARYLALSMALKPAPNVVTGDCAFSATAAIGSGPQRALLRSAEFGSSGQVTASGEVVTAVSVRVTWLAFESPAAYANVVTRSTGFTARVGIAAQPQRDRLRSAALAATGAIDTQPQRALQRSAAFAASGQVAASGGVLALVTRSADVTARASVTASGQVIHVQERGADLLARAGITSSGTVGHLILSGALDVTARGSLGTAPQRELLRAVAFGASGQVESSGTTGPTTVAARVTWISLELPAPSGAPVKNRSAAFQANIQLVAGHQRTLLRSIAIGASGQISAIGYRLFPRSVAFQASGQVSAAGAYKVVSRGADFTARVDVEATPSVGSVVLGSVAVAATAAIGVAPQRALLRSTSYLASGVITAGTSYRVVSRAVDVTARASITATGQVGGQVTRSVAITATGQIGAVPQRALLRATAFTARPAIGSLGEVGGQAQRAVSFTATGTINVGSYRRVHLRSVGVTATGQLSAAGAYKVVSRNVGITATASITAAGAVGGQVLGSVGVTARASITAGHQRTLLRSVAIGASGQISTIAYKVAARSVDLTARPSIASAGTIGGQAIGSIAITARVSFEVGQQRVVIRSVAVAASAQLSSSAYLVAVRTSAITARASITVEAYVIRSRGATFTASASITSSGTIIGGKNRSADFTARPQVNVTGFQRVLVRGVAFSSTAAISAGHQRALGRSSTINAVVTISTSPQRVLVRGGVDLLARPIVYVIAGMSTRRWNGSEGPPWAGAKGTRWPGSTNPPWEGDDDERWAGSTAGRW